jgi:adenosylcobinamide-GDP ribazoletransferase
MPQLQQFLLALTFYTRLPGPQNQDYTKLPQATIYLPLVGWVVGALTALSFYLANLLWQQVIAVILALIVGIFLTGAFHEDGFADVCDGFGGGWGKQRIMEIMKDSFIGVYAVIGLIFIFLLKISILSTLPTTTVPFVLFSGHSISRLFPLLLMQRYNYVRESDSKAAVAVAVYKPARLQLILATIVALIPLLLLPLICLLSIIPLLLGNVFLGRYFYRHIGGYTGDCLGASQQLTETIFYLSISALWIYI